MTEGDTGSSFDAAMKLTAEGISDYSSWGDHSSSNATDGDIAPVEDDINIFSKFREYTSEIKVEPYDTMYLDNFSADYRNNTQNKGYEYSSADQQTYASENYYIWDPNAQPMTDAYQNHSGTGPPGHRGDVRSEQSTLQQPYPNNQVHQDGYSSYRYCSDFLFLIRIT